MVTGRIRSYRGRIRAELERMFAETHTPHQVAGSFAVGVFITMLPTLGTGLALFVVIAYLFESVSKIALFAAVIVVNPVVKWGIYLASFWLGSRLLGGGGGIRSTDISLSAGPDVLARLLVGNLILAVVFTCVGYLVVLRLVREFRRRDLDVEDFVPEPVAERIDRIEDGSD